jgi:hypothetical protein
MRGCGMALSVHLLYPAYDQENLAQLAGHLDPSIHLTSGPDLPTPADYHILVAGRPQREQIVTSPNLHTPSRPAN